MSKLMMGAIALAFAFGASTAVAQTPTPDTRAKQAPGASAMAAQDHTFVKEAAAGGLAEVELGKLATQNAASAEVKKYGQRMVTDHGKANDELKTIAGHLNMKLPTELDAKYKALRDKLAKLNGAEFDKEYMSEMVKDHEQDVAKFRKQARGGQNPELKAFAEKTLTVLEEHLAMAKQISAKVGGTSTSFD